RICVRSPPGRRTSTSSVTRAAIAFVPGSVNTTTASRASKHSGIPTTCSTATRISAHSKGVCWSGCVGTQHATGAIDMSVIKANHIRDHVQVGDLNIWTEQVGTGPDVLLIGGLGDTVESWLLQLDGLSDRYRLTAFDNRGAGRTAMPDGA